MKAKNIQGFTFIEAVLWLLIFCAATVGFSSLMSSANNSDNTKRFINDSVNTDRKIKEIVMKFSDVFKSEQEISNFLKDKFMVNNLKCNKKITECFFNKNTGTEENSLLSSYISVKIDQNKIVMIQKVNSFNGNSTLFISNRDKVYATYFFYINTYDNYLKTEYDTKVKAVYYLANQSDSNKEISKEECNKNENCILVAKYTQKI